MYYNAKKHNFMSFFLYLMYIKYKKKQNEKLNVVHFKFTETKRNEMKYNVLFVLFVHQVWLAVEVLDRI